MSAPSRPPGSAAPPSPGSAAPPPAPDSAPPPAPHPAPPPRRTLILVRHGRSTANGAGVLAGRSDGIELDDLGRSQAERLVERLADADIRRVVSSPILRCRRTVEPLLVARGLAAQYDDRLAELDYGDWTGRALSDLAKEPGWRVVQSQPSAMEFPNGERMAAAAARAVEAAREYGREGDVGVTVLCSHGDIIKAIVCDALGLHLDQFQRIMVSPVSISVVRYTDARPYVERLNDTGTPVGRAIAKASDATVGGDTGGGRSGDTADAE